MGRYEYRGDILQIGAVIKEARLQRHWRQDALAYASGTTQSRISDIEMGYRDISYSTLRRVLNALDLDFAITDLQK